MRCEEEGVEIRRWESGPRGRRAREVVARSVSCLQGEREARGMASHGYLNVSDTEPVKEEKGRVQIPPLEYQVKRRLLLAVTVL